MTKHCSACGKHEGTVRIQTIMGPVSEELWLCRRCADRYGIDDREPAIEPRTADLLSSLLRPKPPKRRKRKADGGSQEVPGRDASSDSSHRHTAPTADADTPADPSEGGSDGSAARRERKSGGNRALGDTARAGRDRSAESASGDASDVGNQAGRAADVDTPGASSAGSLSGDHAGDGPEHHNRGVGRQGEASSSADEPTGGRQPAPKRRSRAWFGDDVPANSRECPSCGLTLAQLKKTGRMGCVHCYTVFRRIVREAMTKQSLAARHVGRLPDRLSTYRYFFVDREELRNELQAALEREDFERAREIHEQLQSGGPFAEPESGGVDE